MASLTAAPAAFSATFAGTDTAAPWGAVYAMALCRFVLVASEFMPVSLLGPIARTPSPTEGQAAHAIAISGAFAVVTSLALSSVLGRADRRCVILALTALLVVSRAIVAFAPSYVVLMAVRALLGIAIGGFWSMSVSIAMRLVTEHEVAKAPAVINGGNAIATVIAAPLGSFMGGLIGWRDAFFSVVPVAVAAIVWQAMTLPRLTVKQLQGGRAMLSLFKRPPVTFGLVTVALLFVGVAGFVGTVLIGRVLDHGLFVTLGVPPAVAVLLAVWGFTGTAAPVVWWTWFARTVPDEAEAGGGLMMAIVQLAITFGATGGGIVFDAAGPSPEFVTSAGLFGLAALAVLVLPRIASIP